jgi:hypothetical protein
VNFVALFVQKFSFSDVVHARYTLEDFIGRANLAFVLLLSLAGRKYAVCCKVAVDFEGFGCICCLFLRVPNLTGFGHHKQQKQSTGRSAAESGFGPCNKGGPAKNLYTKLERMSVTGWLD